ncbi:MAG: ABC transporter permease [Synergistaceae bacterium]|jgi:putative ABC transport system permease protein|nr:ABC transporter permease [Synergistaceae bacterium]
MSEKMSFTFQDIIWCNLKRKPLRSFCLIFLVAALAFVLFGSSLITRSLIKGTDGLAKRLGADLLIVPRGYAQTAEGILLRGSPSAFYMEPEWLEKISGVEGVTAVSPHLFIASLNSDCCSVPIQLIGFDQDTDFIVAPWIKTSVPGILKDNEIVVGGAVAGRVGDTLQFFGRGYSIAAKMEYTGSGFDASVFMNMDAARIAARDCASKMGADAPPEKSISSIMALIDDSSTPIGVAGRINSAFGYVKSGIAVVPAQNIISSVSVSLRMLTGSFGALSAVLWIASFSILALLFSAMLNERRQEFGILRSVGISRKKLIAMVLWESGLISCIGSVVGIFLSALLLMPFRIYIREIFNMPYMMPGFGQLCAIACISVLLSVAAALLASLLSSVKIGNADAYRVIREGGL